MTRIAPSRIGRWAKQGGWLTVRAYLPKTLPPLTVAATLRP